MHEASKPRITPTILTSNGNTELFDCDVLDYDADVTPTP